MKLWIRDRKATVPEKETAWKSDHKCQSYRRRREHERKWAISASLRHLLPKAMKLWIRDRKATVPEKETAHCVKADIGQKKILEIRQYAVYRSANELKVSILSVFETYLLPKANESYIWCNSSDQIPPKKSCNSLKIRRFFHLWRKKIWITSCLTLFSL